MCNCCNSCSNTWQRCGCCCGNQNGSTTNNGSSNGLSNANFGTPAFGLFVPVSLNGSNGSSSCCHRRGTVTVSCCNGTSVRVTCGNNRSGCGCNNGSAFSNSGSCGYNNGTTFGYNGCGYDSSAYDSYYARQYGLNSRSSCGWGCNV